jgi:Protein of unknown function (DUF3602)
MEPRARGIGNDEIGSGLRTTSHGRGGAGMFSSHLLCSHIENAPPTDSQWYPGNMKKDRRPSAGPEDLVTPTIKADKYTTGRGGTGNMAKNDPGHPEVARASQDIVPPAHREPESSFHVGRGGAANIAKPSPGEVEAAKQTNQRREKEVEEAGHQKGKGGGLVEKGKGLLETVGIKR